MVQSSYIYSINRLIKIICAVGVTFCVLSAVFCLNAGATYHNVGYALPDGVYVMFENANNGCMLTDPNNGGSGTYPVTQATYPGASNQTWYVNRLSNQINAFTPSCTPYTFLNVYMAYTANNTNVGIYNVGTSANSKWQTNQSSVDWHGGEYFFSPTHDTTFTKFLTPKNGSPSNNAAVVITDAYTSSTNDQSNWHVVDTNYNDISLWNYNLVDNGHHLDIKSGGTAYYTQALAAARVWNDYRPGVIRNNASGSYETDVTISDVGHFTDKKTIAETAPNGTIKISTEYFNTFNILKKQQILVHELGHALGLGHIDRTQLNFMFWAGTNSTGLTLTNSDKASYDFACRLYQ